MFSATFVNDVTSWITTAPPPAPLEEKQEEVAITINIRPRPPKLSPRNAKSSPRGMKDRTQAKFERPRSLSPISSPKPTSNKNRNLRRSLSQESPIVHQRKGLFELKAQNEVQRPSKIQTETSKPLSRAPITPPPKKRVPVPSTISPTASDRSRRNRPSPLSTKKPHQYGHCSEDPQPSPHIKKMAHLSEETPMSPKVLLPSNAYQGLDRQPSVLNMVKARKQASFMNRGYDAIIKPIARHLPAVNAKFHKNAQVQEQDRQKDGEVTAATKAAADVDDGVDRAKQVIFEEQLLLRWDHQGRPEIEKTQLENDSILDKRHASRSVRCVIWKPPASSKNQKPEKFALKMIMRRKNIKHAANEKDIMLAMDSPWHTKLFNTFKTSNNLYMLMEYASLGSIGSQISWGRGLKQATPELITFYAACLVSAVGYMHKCNIVHRDIKPDNLLIGDDGYLKVCDYGLSKFLHVGSKTRTFLGTLAYMPPEQLNGQEYDHSVDYWGVGICCYEMCYGVTPFEPTGMLTEKEWRFTLKSNIEKAVIRFPDKRIRFSLKLFMKSLLESSVSTRLGGDLDVEKIKAHSCFAKFDWEKLNQRTMVAPTPPEAYSFLGTVL